MPRMVSKIAIATSPMISTSSVLSVRCTSTLSMTTWKNSGETSAKQLQEERGDEHLTKQAPIFMNGAQEPRDVEPAREVDQARPARHQHQVTVPCRLEFGPRHHGGTGR